MEDSETHKKKRCFIISTGQSKYTLAHIVQFNIMRANFKDLFCFYSVYMCMPEDLCGIPKENYNQMPWSKSY